MRTMISWKSQCQACGGVYALEEAVHRCPACLGPLFLSSDYSEMSRLINHADWRHSQLRSGKYWATLPLSNFKEVVSLQEGATPLRRLEQLGKRHGIPSLWAKLENYNPTGVFKDRGSLLELSWVLQRGIERVVCASTGNMAGSVAAYSAHAGVECFIFVPERVPVGKLAQIMAYGAKVIAVRGDYNNCVSLTEYLSQKYGHFLVGDYALRAEGQKTTAYEIIEQLHWRVPEWIIVPMGNGTNIAGMYKGLLDLKELGFISRMPRLVGVQAENVSPIVQAWEKGQEKAGRMDRGGTIAGAVNVPMPLDAEKALYAIGQTHGRALAISEQQIMESQRELSSVESIFVEPSSALSWAAAKRMAQEGIIREEDTVALMFTGHGLKDPKSVLAQVLEPPVINPTHEALDAMWQEKLYALGKVSADEADEVAWEKGSVPEDLRSFVADKFGIHLETTHEDILRRAINDFHEKNDRMRMHSLNLLLEDVTKLPSDYQEILRVLDFHIEVRHHDRPRSRATVRLNGDTYTAESSGVGPVDAIIRGIDDALKKSHHNIAHQLVDYDVEIEKGGTDATVRVHLVLEGEKSVRVTGSAVSPDVISASIIAFERAYNLLHQAYAGN